MLVKQATMWLSRRICVENQIKLSSYILSLALDLFAILLSADIIKDWFFGKWIIKIIMWDKK